MPDDIVLNKVEIIERCLARLEELYGKNPELFSREQNLQDAALLNLQRLCQAAIDLAMRVVRIKKLGLPKQSRDAFALLEKNGILPKEMSEELQKMVGLRNIAIHDYQTLNMAVVEEVLRHKLEVFRQFGAWAVKLV